MLSDNFRKNLMHKDDIARFLVAIVFILPKWIAPAPSINYVHNELYNFINLLLIILILLLKKYINY